MIKNILNQHVIAAKVSHHILHTSRNIPATPKFCDMVRRADQPAVTIYPTAKG